MTRETKTQKAILWSCLFALLAAAFLCLLTCNKLTSAGLYYDELHQAPAAFAYTGLPPQAFAPLVIRGIPLLNMSYSGAIKSGIYGCYLRLSGAPFSALSWRLTGILIAACGLFTFCLLTHRTMPTAALTCFLFLCLTDSSLLLMIRHDWGPIALAFALRLILTALFMRVLLSRGRPAPSFFAIGFLLGLSVFEKLNNIVLIGPAVLFLCFSFRTGTWKQYVWGALGLLLGSAPLILANVCSWSQDGTLISLSQAAEEHIVSLSGFFQHMRGYLLLGHGQHTSSLVLGSTPPRQHFEWMMIIACLAFFVLSVALFKKNKWFRTAAFCGLSYLAVGVLLYLLPRPTSFYHWIAGTPFQYLCIVCGATGLLQHQNRRVVRIIMIAAMVLILVPRLLNTIWLQQQFQHEQHSLKWHPELNQLGEFARDHGENAAFIAADWGVATQLICFMNGTPDKVIEYFWWYMDPQHIMNLFDKPGVDRIYVVTLNPPSNVKPERTKNLLRDVEQLQGDGRLIPFDKQVPPLSAVAIKGYRKESTNGAALYQPGAQRRVMIEE